MKLVDIDTLIEQSEQMTIPRIFETLGEPAFRKIETAVIHRVAKGDNIIISTGGGAVLRQENMDALRETGVIICLKATPDTILIRTGRTNNRPLLQVENPLQRIRELLEYRMPFYEKADIIITTDDKTPLQVAEYIIEKLKGEYGNRTG
jgi:shikimate kinase